MMFTNVYNSVYNTVTNVVNYLLPGSKASPSKSPIVSPAEKTPPLPPQPEKPIEPNTPEEVVNVTNNYIRDADLNQFYPADDPFLRQLAEKASVRIGDPAVTLNTSQDAVDLTKLALYNNVILCGLSSAFPSPLFY